MVLDATMGVAYGLANVRFPAPLTGVHAVAGGLQLTVNAVIEAEGATRPGCTAEPVFRMYGG